MSTIVSQAAVDAAFPHLHGGYEFREEPALRAQLEVPVRHALEAALAAMVEDAHQRMHREFGSTCPGRPTIGCVERDGAYAALDVDDPTMVEMPWREES